MIIREIHIDGFGIFNDFSVKDLDKGVNILLGNNEAGKSTLLAFLRYTLFGYPDPRKKVNQYPPLNGGQQGGRIIAILNSGREVTFERYAGSKGGKIKLLYNGNETQNPSQWAQLLGNASEDLYNNVYAFSLDELVRLDSLSESGVEDKIFSVGLGLGNISIADVENRIRENTENIYKQKGKNQLIPQILNEIKDKREKVQSIQENLPQYQNLTREIRQMEEETNHLDRQIKELREEKNQLDNYLKCYEYFLTVTKADEELKVLPELQDYPEQGVGKLDELEKKEQELYDKIKELYNGTEEEKGVGELEDAIANITFNSELLNNEDLVNYLRENRKTYKVTIEEKTAEEQKIKEYEQSIKTGITNISGSWNEQAISGFTDLTAHTNKIKGYKNEFDRLTGEKRDLDARIKASKEKESPVNVKAIAAVLSAIIFIASVPAIINTSYILGGVLIIISLLLFFGRKHFVREGGYDLLQRQMDDLQEKEQEVEKNYARYLEDQLHLPEMLSPETTLEIFQQIGELKTKINARDELKDKVDTQRKPFIREFDKTVREVRGMLNKDVKEENIEIVVSQIVEEFDHAKQQWQNKRHLEEELYKKKKALENTRNNLKDTQTSIRDLLESIQAQDRQDFRKKYRENEEVKSLIENKNAAIKNIENIVGHNKADEVISYLKNHDKSAIESRVGELADEIDSKQNKWKEKNSALGGKKNELEKIEGESELAEALTELETARQKLQEAYKNWITGKIALDTLNEVKSKYEQEKQPAVIQNSSYYFRKITQENYENIQVSLDEKDVAVYDPRGASKKIEQLSRGTREQLLISLRLGFIEEYEKQAEPLPLIVDEVMVNFDTSRAKQTAEILQEFGENRQILMFTCHPDTEKYFDSAYIKLIQINSLK